MKNRFRETSAVLLGAGIGAGVMFFLDPIAGKRRRAWAKDKATGITNDTLVVIDRASRDLLNRGQGLVAETANFFKADEATDDKIVARVRTRLGRLVEKPDDIKVEAHEGNITFTGSVGSQELAGLMAGVAKIRGVRGIDNQLEEIHADGEDNALQPGDDLSQNEPTAGRDMNPERITMNQPA